MLSSIALRFFSAQISATGRQAYAFLKNGEFSQALAAAERWRDNSKNPNERLRAKSLIVTILNNEEGTPLRAVSATPAGHASSMLSPEQSFSLEKNYDSEQHRPAPV
jgi:hypothetical protein